MKISKELYEFFKAYKRWVEEGVKTSKIFSRRTGLCHNLIYYQDHKGWSRGTIIELRKLLDNEFGHSLFPFGEDSYDVRRKERTQHLCPKRMAFVDKCIEAYESTGNEEKVVKVGDNVKNATLKSATHKSATPKSVWGVVNMETWDFITIELSREKARQMKARLNGEFKIAKMVFDKWVR